MFYDFTQYALFLHSRRVSLSFPMLLICVQMPVMTQEAYFILLKENSLVAFFMTDKEKERTVMLNLCFCITEPSIARNLTGSKEHREDPERIRKWGQRHNKSQQPRTKHREEVRVRVGKNQWSSIWVCFNFRVSDHIIYYPKWNTEALLIMIGQPGTVLGKSENAVTLF